MLEGSDEKLLKQKSGVGNVLYVEVINDLPMEVRGAVKGRI
jgi:hypothetical protein